MANLAVFEFRIYYQSGKAIVEADALLQSLLEQHDHHIETDPTKDVVSSIICSDIAEVDAYACHLHLTEQVDAVLDPKSMTIQN